MKKANSKITISAIGVAVVLVGIIILNAIMSSVNVRLDMTENKQYTLTDNTKRILSKLDTPITIKFYFSKSSASMPIPLKNYGQRVIDLLNEYKQYSNNYITVEKFDPEPDSDAADAATLDGIQGQLTNTGERVYMGIAITCVDQTVALPVLSPQRETLLEYDLTRAISQLTRVKKPVIGVMSALPVMGMKPTMQMMQRGQFRAIPAWLAIQELQSDFDVKEIPMTTESIPDDIDVLLAIHPCGISDKAQFAIDQFLLRGGKLIAFLDPSSYAALTMNSRSNPMMGQKNKLASSDLPILLKAWGIKYNKNKTVADLDYSRHMRSNQGEINHVAVLDLNGKAFNKSEVITAQLKGISMIFAGGFSGKPVDGLTKTSLITSSKHSGLISSDIASKPREAFRVFNEDNKTYDLALMLTGKFKTAFPNGKPGETSSDKAKKDNGKDNKDVASGKYLKIAKKEGVVVLVGDADMLVNQICVQEQTILGQQLRIALNDNLNFLQSATESLAGDSDLIGIRSRQNVIRPFTEVKKMQAEAELKYKKEILELEKELKNAQQRITAIQQRTGSDQRFIISPEVKEELKKFSKKKVEISKKLKVVRRSLRSDINALENTLKFINIALVPILISIMGIMIALYRRKRSSAK